MRVRRPLLGGAALALLVGPVTAWAATPTGFVAGLRAPTKVLMTAEGHLLVSEAGLTATPNQGRVSLVDRSGNARALLDRLPSAVGSEGGPSGPTGIWISGDRTLYLEIGQGDTIRRAAGGEVPNPNGLTSPLFSSVWRIRFGDSIDCLQGTFELTDAALQTLADGHTAELANATGERAWIRVIGDLRDLYPVPQPSVHKVSGSNPFGLVRLGEDVYLPDAGQNSIVRIDGESGRIQTLVRFPPVPNPQFPAVGGPTSQAVPNSLRRLPGSRSLLVTIFTGFPFSNGVSSVQLVDPRDGTAEPFITNLRTAIDVLPIGSRHGPFLVLEYSSGFVPPPAGPGFVFPGRVLRFAARASAPVEVATGLTSPTSMAYDPRTRELFVTEINTGRIMRIEP